MLILSPPLTFFLFDESLIDYLDYSYAICVSFELLFFYVRLLSLDDIYLNLLLNMFEIVQIKNLIINQKYNYYYKTTIYRDV